MKTAFLALLFLPCAWANYRAQGDCYQGGQVVVTSGVNSTTFVERSFPTCTVTVYPTGSSTPVPAGQIFSDNMGTVLGNPFTANQTGHWFFYAANGRYDVQISGGGLASPITFGDIPLNDPASTNTNIPVPTQPLTYLRTQPNAGNNTTLQWSLLPTVYASDYNFPPIAPGGTLTAGVSNTVTLPRAPLGVSGSDVGHLLYVSGGVGTAEAVTITGGTCVSGANAPCTIIFTPANSHSGAWTIQSISGGLQESICAMPSSGGSVAVTSSIMLFANVSNCGKAIVTVQKLAGSTISGGTILGGSSLGSAISEGFAFPENAWNSIQAAAPNWTGLTAVTPATRVAVNNFPIGQEFQGGTTVSVVGIDGAVDGPSGGTYGGALMGVSGYTRTNNATMSGGAAAVGVYGASYIGVQATGMNATQAWGANFLTNNCAVIICSDGMGFNQNNSYGLEVDVNMYRTAGAAAATNAIGVWITGASTHQPSGTADGIAVGQIGTFNNISWKNAVSIRDGAANVGIMIGTLTTGNATGSQPIYLKSRDASGMVRQASILSDQFGVLALVAGAGAEVAIEDGAGNIGALLVPSGSTPSFQVNNNLTMGTTAPVVIPLIKSTTGQRYVCVTTTGQLVSSVTACSGT